MFVLTHQFMCTKIEATNRISVIETQLILNIDARETVIQMYIFGSSYSHKLDIV